MGTLRRALGRAIAWAVLAGPVAAWGQGAAAPAPPAAARVGQAMDVSGDPVLAGLPVTRLTVDVDRLKPALAARAMSVAPPAVDVNPNYGSPKDVLVSLHLKDVPLMEALMEFRQQSHCVVRQATAELVTFGNDEQEEATPPWCTAGPFAVVLYGIAHPTMGAGETHMATLRMGLLAEPGVHLVRYMRDLQCPGLEDERHQPILVRSAMGMEYGMNTDMSQPAEAVLNLPVDAGRRMPVFKGTMDALLVNTKKVDLANVTEKQTARVGGMTLEVAPLAKMNPNATSYSLVVTYGRGEMPVAMWKRVMGALASGKLHVLAADKGELPVLGMPQQVNPQGSPQGGPMGNGFGGRGPANSADVPERLSLRYMLAVPAGKASGAATLEVPVEAVEARVPFEFKNVILP